MNKKYYFNGSLIGLVAAFFMAWGLLGKSFLLFLSFDFYPKFQGATPILVGIICALVLARYLDKKELPFNFLVSGLLIPLAIFLLAALAGSFSNWVVNGALGEFNAWAFRPLAGLCLFGVPSALVIGAIYHLAQVFFFKHKWHQV